MGFYLAEFTPLMDSQVCEAGVQFGMSESFFYLPGWAAASLVALAASAMLLAFLYMLASAFQNQRAVGTVKVELYEFAVTACIFAVLFMLLNGMCGVKAGSVYPDIEPEYMDKTIYFASTNYLMDFADYTLRVMSMQYMGYVFIDWVTSMEITSVPMGIGATLRPTSGLGAVVKPVLNNAFTAEAIGVITAEAQAYVLDFGTYGLLKYFLPLGLILRSFLPTRRLGGTIIALNLVFLFLYPLLVIPTYAVVNSSLLTSIDYFEGAIGAEVIGAGTSFWMLLQLAFKYLWGPDFLLAYSLATLPTVAKVFLGAVFMPLFNTVVLITAARYLSRALGEEIDITNLTRMI